LLRKDIKPGAEVKRGYSELGNFFYGGSLNIPLSKGMVSPAVQTRLGNQIGIINVAPPATRTNIVGMVSPDSRLPVSVQVVFS